jgi:predicted ArsR family transcriptional regulator
VGVHPRQPATRAEARALAHPVRLRIIRLTRDEALTITQLSDALALDKATVLHHVRTLVRQGFLAETERRRSPAGRPEKPYRSTGKPLTLIVDDTPELSIAVLDAYRQEIAGHRDPSPVVVRRPLRLGPAARKELADRLGQLVDEFDARNDPDGEPINFLAVAVRTPPTASD